MNKKLKKIERCEVFDHDFRNLIRKGRANWVCRRCGKNVMILLVYAQDAGIDLTK